MNRLARLALYVPLLLALLLGAVATHAQPSEPPAQNQFNIYLPLVSSGGQPSATLPPLSISVALDAAHATQREIGSAGGQLSAVGADGTAYTLAVPAGALAYTQTLSLTPGASVAGLPLSGGSLGAVQLAPADLVLMRSATLTISTLVDHDEALASYGYGFDGTGAEFHLRSVDQAAALQSIELAAVKIITIRVPKLRGYGVAKGKPAEATQHRQRNRPTRLADQLAEDDLFVPLSFDALIARLEQDHAQIIGLLNQSASNPGLIEDAVVAYVEWSSTIDRAVNDPGRFANHRQQFRESLRTAIKNASARSYQRCIADHNLAEGLLLQRWLYALYTYALPMDPSYLEALVTKCFTFDLAFSANFVRNGKPSVVGAAPLVIEAHVEALVRLRPQMNYPQFSLVGQSELTVRRASTTSGSPCTASYVQGAVAPVRVIDLLFKPKGNSVQVASLLFDTGTGIEGQITFECENAAPRTSNWPLYASEFYTMHSDEAVAGHAFGQGGIFRLANHWQPGTGAQVATTGTAYHREKTFVGGYTYVFDETTTFTITHRPS